MSARTSTFRTAAHRSGAPLDEAAELRGSLADQLGASPLLVEAQTLSQFATPALVFLLASRSFPTWFDWRHTRSGA